MVTAVLLTSRTEWASGDHSQVVEWDTGTSDDIVYHRFSRANQQQFVESREIASWGQWYLATRSGNSVRTKPLNGGTGRSDPSETQMTWQIGQDTVVRDQFVNNGRLANTKETNFRPVSDRW